MMQYERSLQVIKDLRAQYAKNPTTGRLRPGSHDIIKLCDACDDLCRIIYQLQAELSADEQNEVGRLLWHVEQKIKFHPGAD